MKMKKMNWIPKFEGSTTSDAARLFSDDAIYNILGENPGQEFNLLYDVSTRSIGQLVDNAMACGLQGIQIYYTETGIVLCNSFSDFDISIELPVVLEKIVEEFQILFEEDDYFDNPQGQQSRMVKMLRDAADKIEALKVLEP